MYKCKCLTREGTYIEEDAYSISEFKLKHFLTDETTKNYIKYPATFDIETTTIKPTTELDKPYAFMYIWQFCIKGQVIFGRTWKEFINLLENIKEVLDLNEHKKLVIYVHNLSFEFEFIRKFIDFDNVFATAPHKVLKCSNAFFEFRCSYYLSNMNLNKFISNTPTATHMKGVNDLDYKKIRTPNTKLKPVEYGYCYNDVKGLEEAILFLLESDTLKTIPLTSTGYVRRDCRLAMRKNKKNRKQFNAIKLNKDLFILCQECFRGGNTASSRYYCNELLKKVGSYDLSSSYPYVMLACDYPVGAFIKYSVDSEKELDHLNGAYCTIGRYLFKNIRIKKGVPIPYIPISKVETNESTVFNGRLLKGEYCKISITNIDYEIIKNQYDFDELYVTDFYIARKGKLPDELRNQIMHYYELKTQLKDDCEHEYEYMKAKNKLNSIYGMMVTNIAKGELTINDQGEWIEEECDIQELLDKYYKSWNSFLSYQWGVFVTANARKRLQKGIDKVGLDTVYCDTDSVKYLNNHDDDFKKLNENVESFVAYRNGKAYPMGVWDNENQKGKYYEYNQFKTLGAKKYAFTKNRKIGITVSGLSKKSGAKELKKKGGLSKFKNGEIFLNSGRTVAYFNNEEVHDIIINNEVIQTASNIAIVETTYTLGITDTMLDIIDLSKEEEYGKSN